MSMPLSSIRAIKRKLKHRFMPAHHLSEPHQWSMALAQGLYIHRLKGCMLHDVTGHVGMQQNCTVA